MPARRRNPPPTSAPPPTTPPTTSGTSSTARPTSPATLPAVRTRAAVAMATTTTLRRSPRLIVTGHYHQPRALQKQAESKTKNLKRPCCQPGRTRAGRGVLPDTVAIPSSSSSTSEEDEEDTRMTSCTTRRKRKENSTTLLVESPAKRLRTRAVVVTATAPPKPRSKPKVSSQAPSPSSAPRSLPVSGRLTRSSTIASRATTAIHKAASNKNNVPSTSRRSSPELAPPQPPPAPPSPPPQHGPPLISCKSNASSPASSPSTSAFTLLASSPQRAPLEMIDIGPPLISHNESSRHSGFSGIPGLISSAEYNAPKDYDQCIKEGTPIKMVTGTGIWTSPPSPLTPLSTAPSSPTSPTDVFDIKLDLMLSSSLSSSPPPSPVLPSGLPSLAAAQGSMNVDAPNTASDSSLAIPEAVSVTQNIHVQTGQIPAQSEGGVNIPPPMTQPSPHPQPLTMQDMTTMATYGFSQEQSPQFQLAPQAQPQSSQSQSQHAQGQMQVQPQSQQPQSPQQPSFTHPYTWYDLPESSAQQQQILHWEEPPRLESIKNVWKFACKYRVWDVLCRYTPNIIRSVVAQEASDYHTVHGFPNFSRVRHQRMKRRVAMDTSAASRSGGATRGISASSSGPTFGGRKKRRKVEVDEKTGEEKDNEKKGPKSKSRNGSPAPDVMEGVEAGASSSKERLQLQVPLVQPSPTSPSPESEREKFMDEEYYDWEIRSDGEEDEEEDEEVFYYYEEDDDDEDEEDDDDECYDEETDSEDEDYMDDEVFDGSQAIEGAETIEKPVGNENVSAQISEDGKKKHRTGDASLMDMDVSKDPSFNAELTSLSCSSTPLDGVAEVTSTADPSVHPHQEDVGTAERAEPSSSSVSAPPSSSGATTPSFRPSMPPHSSNSNVASSARGDTLISMFYCPPPHPQHVNHLNSHVHSPQMNLAAAPQQQLQTEELSSQHQSLSHPQSVQGQPLQPLQPMDSPQPIKPLQPIPSTQPLHPSLPPTSPPFASDPPSLSPPPRPSTPVPTPSVFCMNEYDGTSDRYQPNTVPATASSSPLAPISPVNPITPTQPLTPITPISPLSTPIPAPPVLPLPPPRLASIRVRPLRYGDLGLTSVIGKGTPVDRDRAMQWARAGQCGFTWPTAASGASTSEDGTTRGREMSDVVMKDAREESQEPNAMGEVTSQERCTTNSMTLGSVNNEECQMSVDQGQRQGHHQTPDLPSQPQLGHQPPTQEQPQGSSQEQEKMQIVAAFSETDQSIWDAFFATLQAAEHDVTGEVKPQPSTEATSSPGQNMSMLNPGETNTVSTTPGTSTGSVGASSPQMSENGNNGTSSAAPGNSVPPALTAMNVNATTTAMFTSMGFGLGGALGMGFVSGSVNVNHISLGFGPSSGVLGQQGSSVSGDQCSNSSTPSPLSSNLSGGPIPNMLDPLFPVHHSPVVGDISGMTMNGVQTYLAGSPLSVPLSMSMPMGMPGMGTISPMGMTIPMPVVPSHESSSSPPSTPMATVVGGSSPSCPGTPTPGTSALSFALG